MKVRGSWRAGLETIANYRMYYREWLPAGGGTTLPVIALHGSLSQSGMWVASAESIARARIICPDQRGYGRSEDPGWGDAAAEFSQDAIRLADALFIDRFTVMGHSFACAIALHVAMLEPDRVAGVVLVDPTVRNQKGARANLDQMSERPERFENHQEAQQFWKETEEGSWPSKNLARFVNDVMVSTEDGAPCRMPFEIERLIRLRAYQASDASDYQPLSLAKKVKSPVLIYRGGASRRFSEEAEERLTGAFSKKPEVVVCPKAGHFPPVQEAGLFEKSLVKFLPSEK
jgi:pimeloyl-ACP methyl ester carboxylesterase